MRGSEWPPSRASSSSPCGSRSNVAPEGDELVHPRRPFVDEHPHGVDVAQAGAGGERVGQVQVGAVRVAAEHRGHAALRPPRGGLLELGLGEHAHPHAVDLGGPHRRRQPGHPRPQHQQVQVGVGHGHRSTCRAAPPFEQMSLTQARERARPLGAGGEVVDEAGLAEAHGGEEAELARQRVDHLERSGVDHLGVVELRKGLGAR